MITVKLDYTLESSLERKEYVEKIVEENPDLTNDDLEVLADYLIFCMEKEERKQKKILTENRMVTINKRETSYQALADKFENGEDGIYAIKNDNKHILFQPKQKITPHDIDTLPGMREVQEAIEAWKKISATATGRNKYLAKKALIDFRKQQYQIKSEYLIHAHSIHYSLPSTVKLESEEWVEADGTVRWGGISLCDPRCCSGILCNYSNLKQNAWEHPTSDLWCIMQDFDTISWAALQSHPLLLRITELKIDGLSNQAIQEVLDEEFGTTHSLEYISSLWRKKIPNLISDLSQEYFLNWYYTFKERGKYKRCSRCGKVKLAHSRYFSKNNTSKDGFYSICKNCRNGQKTSINI